MFRLDQALRMIVGSTQTELNIDSRFNRVHCELFLAVVQITSDGISGCL